MAFSSFVAIVIGSLGWGTPLNTAIQNHDRALAVTTPLDHEMIAWNVPPGALAGTTVPTSGTVLMQKIFLRQPTVITNVCYGVGVQGAALTAGQNFAGLYDSSGNRLGVTADQSVSWITAGFKQTALTAPTGTLAAGAYYVALLSNGGTPPAWARGGITTASIANPNLTAANGAYTTGPAAQTSLPVSITMASRTLSANPTWSGVS